MSTGMWSFYDPQTGLFSGGAFSGPEYMLAGATPHGLIALAGCHDHSRVRVDVETGRIIPYQPAAPAHDARIDWAWDAERWQWTPTPTQALLDDRSAAAIRAERARRIAELQNRIDRCLRQQRMGEPTHDDIGALDACMQALADVTKQPTFPVSVVWPTEP